MKRELIINGKIINDESDCFVIAEIGNNHCGSVKICKDLIKAAAEAGADAVKLQKRDNSSLFTKKELARPYDNPNSYGPTYGEHREALELNIEEFVECQKYSKELGITFFSTAFDINSANQLEEIDVPAYKIASGDLKSIPLLKHVAKFQKPMIISTGGALFEDVKRAYEAIMPINKQLCIMQCTAAYPAEFDQLNLKVIETYRKAFPDIVIGLSSHDNGIAIPLVGYMLGATIVEKHFTLNRAWKGTDHAFSLEPVGLKKMVRDLRRTKVSLGDGIKKPYDTEKSPLLKMSKSLTAKRDLKAGHVLTDSDLTMKIPGSGIPPYEWDKLIGKKLKQDVPEDHMFTYGDFS